MSYNSSNKSSLILLSRWENFILFSLSLPPPGPECFFYYLLTVIFQLKRRIMPCVFLNLLIEALIPGPWGLLHKYFPSFSFVWCLIFSVSVGSMDHVPLHLCNCVLFCFNHLQFKYWCNLWFVFHVIKFFVNDLRCPEFVPSFACPDCTLSFLWSCLYFYPSMSISLFLLNISVYVHLSGTYLTCLTDYNVV